MSYFQFNQMNYQVDPEKLKMAEYQFDSIAKTFDTMLNVCRTKCIPGVYYEADLHKGESVCIDRCVTKFMSANVIVGELMKEKRFAPEDLPAYKYTKT